MQAFVENLPKWRDATLVLAGLAYVLGFLSWAIYASSHGLGLVPVLDAQYFAAGVLPALIVIVSCLIGWWLRLLGEWVRKPVSPGAERARSVLEVIGILCILAGFVWLLSNRKFPIWPAILIIGGGAIMAVSSFLSRKKTDTWYHRLVLGLAWFYLPLFGVSGFLLYTAKIFPDLPQAFGGPRPQRVQLDVDVSKISPNTLHLLAPEWPSQTNQSIARSRSLDLVFQSRDYVFLQINSESSSANNQSFRLQSSTVLSLVPVPDESAR